MYEVVEMICPVCKTENDAGSQVCINCGFGELNITFVNIDDAQHWENTVLTQCRNIYKTMLAKTVFQNKGDIVNNETISNNRLREAISIYRGHGYVITDSCVDCGACVEVCSEGAIVQSDTQPTIDPSKCISCGSCEDCCPVGAVKQV